MENRNRCLGLPGDGLFRQGGMMRAGILLFLLGLILDLGAEDKMKPFPANRVRDFYREEARRWLEHQGEMPKILPQFPGLDGGV